MDMELSPPDCSFDGVSVHELSVNGNGEVKEKLLGKYCGQEAYAPALTESNQIRVVFYADDNNERAGFNMTWRAISKTSM